MKFYIYDLETLLNCFTFTGKYYGTSDYQTFELSSRKDQKQELLDWLSFLQKDGVYMVGYNSLNFDYPILHDLLTNIYTFNYTKAYNFAQMIIGATYGKGFQVRLNERIIPQIDLVKVNHFDNEAKRTPLKTLQCTMRMPSVVDMPVPLNVNLTNEQMDSVIEYNRHDVLATELFLTECLPQIKLRQELIDNGDLTGDVLNYSDVKIGTEYLIKRIGRAKCFDGYNPRQTRRSTINVNEIVLPKISFRSESFESVLDWFKSQTIVVKSKETPSLKSEIEGLEFAFGVGGAHASVNSKVFESNDEYVIRDVDVAGMYPSVAVANRFAPEHLGESFLVAYSQLKSDRKNYPKGTSKNALLKLAGNGAFGNSDNPFSCLYDPRMPKQITINGQLQILQLAEILSFIPDLKLIQVNTDGITFYVRRDLEYLLNLWLKVWESDTGLELEQVDYQKMWIANVSNYLAVTTKGKIKAKGAYWYPKTKADYEGNWNKNYSMMIVQKLAQEALIHGHDVMGMLLMSTDPFDFMINYKANKSARIYVGGREQQKTVRYYVSTKGEDIIKIAEPTGEIGQYKRKTKISDDFYNNILSEIGPGVWDERIHSKNKSKYDLVSTNLESGWKVKVCNLASDFCWDDVDYSYYLKEIQKLLIT